jgi:TolB-like protein
MAGKPNKLSQFWSELKRRRVVYVVTVYASAAFVIIELVNNLTEPLNLPPDLATIAIILLAVGFPLAVILGWIYDLTPGGIEKTKPFEESGKETVKAVPNKWRITTYASFLVIAGLVVLNIVRGPGKLHAGDIQSIVILPFENYTGDEQMANMVAGMHSLLIGDMGRISGLRVIGKTSSRIYREVDMTAKDIARELNVDAVVEASVMCVGDSVCMQFSLVNTTGDEEQLWVGDYKEDKGQILNMYNRVTKKIAEEVLIELTDQEEQLLTKDRAADREALDAYIRSHRYWGDLSTEAMNKAEEYLTLAIEKDPDWAPLYSAKAILWGARLQMGQVENESGRQKLYEYLNKANELDPNFIDFNFVNAVISVWTEWNWDKGEKEFLKALAVSPNHVMSRMYYAHLLMTLQRIDEALVQAKLALDGWSA